MSNANSVPLTCDKCSHSSELSTKEWEQHWHGVEFKCSQCDNVLMHNDSVLQSMGVHSGVISKNKKTADAVCKNCGHDSQKTWNEMDKHRWGVEYKCPKCDFVMFKDKPNLYKMASQDGLIDYPLKEKANVYFWMLIMTLPWIILLFLAGCFK
jgi:predicted RNA-binding Zn-ribbon protein involved in translation (DUF1610 family)